MLFRSVDDIIATGSAPEELDLFRNQLKSQWEITELGEPKLALGIAVSRDRANRTISLSQAIKIDNLMEEYGQVDAQTVDTPMTTGLQHNDPTRWHLCPMTLQNGLKEPPTDCLWDH